MKIKISRKEPTTIICHSRISYLLRWFTQKLIENDMEKPRKRCNVKNVKKKKRKKK